MILSKKYRFNLEDLRAIAKVVMWSTGSAFVAVLLLVVEQVDFGMYVFLVPAINAILYAAQRFFQGKLE